MWVCVVERAFLYYVEIGDGLFWAEQLCGVVYRFYLLIDDWRAGGFVESKVLAVCIYPF